MRYIDLDEVKLEICENETDWLAESHRLTIEIQAISPSERIKFIQRKQKHWSKIKDILAHHSFDKCWYCESKKNRSKMAIDHFRPKSKIYDCPDHPGYWWLAFNFTNFRYCCDECNELTTDRVTKQIGGKYTHFPLDEGSPRATQECELELERPLLLDPTVIKDCSLIAFDKTSGKVVCSQENDFSKLRVDTSIKRYHLNKSDLVKRRFQEVCYKIEKLVSEGTEYVCKKDEEGEIRIETELNKMIQPKAEFSEAARSILMYHRDKQWVEEIVLRLRRC